MTKSDHYTNLGTEYKLWANGLYSYSDQINKFWDHSINRFSPKALEEFLIIADRAIEEN